jgi:hypothetical protein
MGKPFPEGGAQFSRRRVSSEPTAANPGRIGCRHCHEADGSAQVVVVRSWLVLSGGGLWPVSSIASFKTVTAPKTEKWLSKITSLWRHHWPRVFVSVQQKTSAARNTAGGDWHGCKPSRCRLHLCRTRTELEGLPLGRRRRGGPALAWIWLLRRRA